MRKLAFLTIVAILGISISATAQCKASNKKILKTQSLKINQGIINGSLTKNEAFKLKKEQAHLAKTIIRAKSDGVITPREHKIIRHKQVVAARHINKEKHDRQVRL